MLFDTLVFDFFVLRLQLGSLLSLLCGALVLLSKLLKFILTMLVSLQGFFVLILHWQYSSTHGSIHARQYAKKL